MSQQQPKRSKMPSLFLLALFGAVIGYVHGYRIITLEEVPSSHRPVEPFLSADYGSQHFTQSE